MNGLSWLLYLADVCNNVGWLVWWATFVCVGALALGGIAFVATGCAALDGDKEAADVNKTTRRFIGRMALPAFGLMILAGAIPTKETVYAIAASELGESVLHSKTGGKAVQALDAWLDRQIASAMSAGTAETPKEAQGEARQRGGEAETPND